MSIKHLSTILAVSVILLNAQVKNETPAQTLDEYLAGIQKSPKSVEALKDAIENGNDVIKSKALSALANMGAIEAKYVFTKYIKYGVESITVNRNRSEDLSWLVRAECAIGLAKLKDKTLSKHLRHALELERNDVVTKTIIYALGELEDDEAVNQIMKIMEISSKDPMVIECVQSLGKIGNKKCFLPLLTVSTGTFLPVTKREAIKALEKIKW